MDIRNPELTSKRQCSELLSTHETPQRALEKRKRSQPDGSHISATFWDDLSKIWVTRNALRELDRRNDENARKVQHQTPHIQFSKIVQRASRSFVESGSQNNHIPRAGVPQPLPLLYLKGLQRYARAGGPDLSGLRGYREPNSPLLRTMSSRSQSRVQKSTRRGRALSTVRSSSLYRSALRSKNAKTTELIKSTEVKAITELTKSSSPYDCNFQQCLIDNGVFPPGYEYPDGRQPPKPDNWNDIKERLARPRPSLSPSAFTEEDHAKFVRLDDHALKDKQIMETVVPIIEGDVGSIKCVARDVPFTNLHPLVNGKIVPGHPHRYYGAYPEQLDSQVRHQLGGDIIPSTRHDLPILPNFLLQVKGLYGGVDVATRQANYHGALGARGMDLLEIYGKENPSFHENALTISSIYHYGSLKMFTIHTSKAADSDRTEYHMTQLNHWGMSGNVDTFRQGATWYRNGRDWAKEQRDRVVMNANERAKVTKIGSMTVTESFQELLSETSSVEPGGASVVGHVAHGLQASDSSRVHIGDVHHYCGQGLL
jgi:hypothetical protein